ncbi:MAG TPA: dihydrofolate reductase [Burkholderiales bacterium]|nr:dihydrofolate reductase [Burkholderiales bacterium]
MKKTVITAIAAINKDMVIGIDNKLPWHIPEDLKFFKEITFNKPVIMGRKTFESIGKALPNRKNIVISNNKELILEGAFVYSSLIEAINDNKSFPEICIIGGEEIFKQAIKFIDKLYLTIVDVKVNNPTAFFPKINFNEWHLIKQNSIISKSGINCNFKEYERNGVKNE